MAKAKRKPTAEIAPQQAGKAVRVDDDEADVEGHNFLLHPIVARDLARLREAELQREAEMRRLAKQARPNKHDR